MKKDAEYYRKYRAAKKVQPGSATIPKSATNDVQPATKAQPSDGLARTGHGSLEVSAKEPDYTWLDISPKLFDGVGRGTPIKIENREDRCVLISKGWVTIEGGQDLTQGVVSEEAWKARLDYTCKHGRPGWSCKPCLH